MYKAMLKVLCFRGFRKLSRFAMAYELVLLNQVWMQLSKYFRGNWLFKYTRCLFCFEGFFSIARTSESFSNFWKLMRVNLNLQFLTTQFLCSIWLFCLRICPSAYSFPFNCCPFARLVELPPVLLVSYYL